MMEGGVVQTRCRLVILLILMDPHVTIEVARLRESELTQLTLVGLLTAMNPHMFGQCGRV